MIHSAVETILQIWIIVMAFQTSNGVRHSEEMTLAFTSEEKCEAYARKTMLEYYQRIDGLYWYCHEVRVNP